MSGLFGGKAGEGFLENIRPFFLEDLLVPEKPSPPKKSEYNVADILSVNVQIFRIFLDHLLKRANVLNRGRFQQVLNSFFFCVHRRDQTEREFCARLARLSDKVKGFLTIIKRQVTTYQITNTARQNLAGGEST